MSLWRRDKAELGVEISLLLTIVDRYRFYVNGDGSRSLPRSGEPYSRGPCRGRRDHTANVVCVDIVVFNRIDSIG